MNGDKLETAERGARGGSDGKGAAAAAACKGEKSPRAAKQKKATAKGTGVPRQSRQISYCPPFCARYLHAPYTASPPMALSYPYRRSRRGDWIAAVSTSSHTPTPRSTSDPPSSDPGSWIS